MSLTILRVSEIDALFDVLDTDRPLRARDACMLNLMVFLGLTTGEVLNLEQGQLQRGKIKLPANSDTTHRVINVPKRVDESLKKWLTEGNRWRKENNLVFITYNGEKVRRNQPKRVVDRTTEQSNIEKSIKPGNLRHTFGVQVCLSYVRLKNSPSTDCLDASFLRRLADLLGLTDRSSSLYKYRAKAKEIFNEDNGVKYNRSLRHTYDEVVEDFFE